VSGPSTANSDFERLLEYLRQNRGFDFTGYKRPSLMRRVTGRMQAVNIEGFPEYLDYLEVHPEEFVALFNTVLINVTSFFRDEPTWKFLAEVVCRRSLAAKRKTCRFAPGAPAAPRERKLTPSLCSWLKRLAKTGFITKVKIYATDVDEEALITARQATYSEKAVQAVPPDLREKYFERITGSYVLNSELRHAVIFGRHDLVQDATILPAGRAALAGRSGLCRRQDRHACEHPAALERRRHAESGYSPHSGARERSAAGDMHHVQRRHSRASFGSRTRERADGVENRP
jgi:chemotaxis methyl-accepting protein methylase